MQTPNAGRQAVAYHEAGHAVIACLLGIPLRRATIIPKGPYAGRVDLLADEAPAHVCPWNPDWQARDARRYWARHVCAILAGALAETLHTRCWQQQPPSDEQTDEYQALAIADYLDPPAKAGRWVNQLRFQTLEALRLPGVWSAVDTVAKALVNRQTLNGPRVHALVCQTLPCAPAAGVPMNATPWPLFKAAAKRPARRKLGQ